MAVLSFQEIEKVNRVIAEIYAAREPHEFFQKIVAAVKDLLSSDLASYNEYDADLRITKVVNGSPEHDQIYKKHEEAVREYLPTHPGFSVSSLNRCTMLADLVSPAEFERTSLYNEYYRHLDIRSQVFTELPVPQGMRSILMLSRTRPLFTEKERFMLGLMKPHVIQALRTTLELHNYRERIALFGEGEEFPALRTFGLTAREATILGWAAKGKTNADIASILGISRRTVEKHFEHIYEKLGVETKIAAVSVIVNATSPGAYVVADDKTP